MEMHREEIVDPMPGVAENVLPREVVELTGIHHEGQQVALFLLKGLIEQPYRLNKRNVYVRCTVQHE